MPPFWPQKHPNGIPTMQKGIRFTVVFSLGHEWLLPGDFYVKSTLFDKNHEFHKLSWKSRNSVHFACGSGTSVCGVKRHINNCSFLGIPDDTFAGNSWISWLPCFSHKIMDFCENHDFNGISWISCFSAPSAPSGAMERLRNYYCFLTLGAQRAQKRGFHQKSWNSRENPRNSPFTRIMWNSHETHDFYFFRTSLRACENPTYSLWIPSLSEARGAGNAKSHGI